MPVQKQRSELNIDVNGYETAVRGDPAFPCCAYWWDLTNPMFDEIPWHWHEDFEVLYVKSGALQICVNDSHFQLKEGEGAFINSNAVHSIRTAAGMISTLNSFVFDPEILSGSVDSAFNQKYLMPLIRCHELPYILFRHDAEWKKQTSRCIYDAYVAYDEEKFGYELIVREKLSHMIYLIVTNNESTIKHRTKSEDKDIKRLKAMMSYIHQHYRSRIYLQQIASAANISRRECLRCFNKTIGISPIQYLIKYRISVAARLLAESDSTITGISDKTGFDNSGQFARTFKSHYSCSPSDYRKKQRKGA